MKKLLKLALIVGGVAAASKFATSKRADWTGLTESQVRAKMDSRLPNEMPAEKREMVMDKVVTGLRDKGMLKEEPTVASETSA